MRKCNKWIGTRRRKCNLNRRISFASFYHKQWWSKNFVSSYFSFLRSCCSCFMSETCFRRVWYVESFTFSGARYIQGSYLPFYAWWIEKEKSQRNFLALKLRLANYFEDIAKEDIFDYIPPQKRTKFLRRKADSGNGG